jgi:hypothetical protein
MSFKNCDTAGFRDLQKTHHVRVGREWKVFRPMADQSSEMVDDSDKFKREAPIPRISCESDCVVV